MDELKNTNPQQLLEDAFRAIYEKDSADEAQRIEEERELNCYQLRWCSKFEETFGFVSQYGGKVVSNVESDFNVKLHHLDKCSVDVYFEGYSITVHPPKPGEERCRCFEHYIFDGPFRSELMLTLPEITTHISKGLAKAGADLKHLK